MVARAGMGVSVSTRAPSADSSRHLALWLCTWLCASFQDTFIWSSNGRRACLRSCDLGGILFRGTKWGGISRKKKGQAGSPVLWRLAFWWRAVVAQALLPNAAYLPNVGRTSRSARVLQDPLFVQWNRRAWTPAAGLEARPTINAGVRWREKYAALGRQPAPRVTVCSSNAFKPPTTVIFSTLSAIFSSDSSSFSRSNRGFPSISLAVLSSDRVAAVSSRRRIRLACACFSAVTT